MVGTASDNATVVAGDSERGAAEEVELVDVDAVRVVVALPVVLVGDSLVDGSAVVIGLVSETDELISKVVVSMLVVNGLAVVVVVSVSTIVVVISVSVAAAVSILDVVAE